MVYPGPLAKDDLDIMLDDVSIFEFNVIENDSSLNPDVELDPKSVVLYFWSVNTGTISGTTIEVPDEGNWSVNPEGIIKFQALDGFIRVPAPIAYTVSDTNGDVSNRAVVSFLQSESDTLIRPLTFDYFAPASDFHIDLLEPKETYGLPPLRGTYNIASNPIYFAGIVYPDLAEPPEDGTIIWGKHENGALNRKIMTVKGEGKWITKLSLIHI